MGCFGFLLLALSSTLLFTLNSAQTYLYASCNIKEANLKQTSNSSSITFEANLNLLLAYISNNTNPFYNNTVGRSPYSVYGLFQCRGDYNSQDCHRCSQIASQAISLKCPYKKEAVIYYEQCLLHYSDTDFISNVVYDYPWGSCDDAIVSDPSRLPQVLNELMDGLVVQAVSNASSLFAAGERNFTTSQKLYGLVQCTQDLTASDCKRCLRESVSMFPAYCDGKRNLGGRIVKPSCNVRYQNYKFFQLGKTTTQNSNNRTGQGKRSWKNIVVIAVPSIVATILLSTLSIFFCLRRKGRMKKFSVDDVDEISTVEQLQFNLATIKVVTDNFSDANRLGEGGFGAVYKGKLSDEQEIAVKRLSINSGQGVKEFKNEVLLLARLQHRNLVRLLGFCLERKENILIYEFVPNSSLDKFIFDPIKRTILDWKSRYKIIGGIARGLQYLHEDSRYRIIHRDLKASNVLLDAQMNPKISDFGLARLFEVDQTRGCTNRIVGTYGYMAPEYAMHGHYSLKSDVFSFGVLVLEIINGHKNNSCYESECGEDLLSYTWKQWEEGTALELLEPACRESYSRPEVMRCIHMGLLCVQDVARRPTMASVVRMLDSDSITLPLPSRPAFFVKSKFDTIAEEMGTDATNLCQKEGLVSSSCVDKASITELYPR